MPYIFVSTVALFSNLYRCAPLVVGDKDSDKELMDFLGAKYTSDYPGHKAPVYVLYATPRSLMDALQTKGYSLVSTQMLEDYVTWTLSSPGSDNPPEEENKSPQSRPKENKAPQSRPEDKSPQSRPEENKPPQSRPEDKSPQSRPEENKSPPSRKGKASQGTNAPSPKSLKSPPMDDKRAESDDGPSHEDLKKVSSSMSKASRSSSKSLTNVKKKMDFKENPDQSAVARPKQESKRSRSKSRQKSIPETQS